MKVKFFSFLGTNNYNPAMYIYKDKNIEYKDEKKENFVQISIYNIINKLLNCDQRFINEDDSKIDTYIFLTEKAKIKNYLGEALEGKKVDYEPMCYYKDKMNITPVNIYDGMTEDEIWKNFNIILDIIEPGDLIFTDITHSIRSLPIMFMSLLNFAKVSKNISIGGIYYGAYEMGKSDIEGSVSEILNLVGFDTVTDWSSSVDMLLTKGGSKRFCFETKSLVKEIKRTEVSKSTSEFLRDVEQVQKTIDGFFTSLNFCDVKLACDKIKLLKQQTENIQKKYGNTLDESVEKIKPLMSLFMEIESFIKDFKVLDCGSVKNTVTKTNGKLSIKDQYNVIYNVKVMVDLCMKFDLYQQAITFLDENITSIITHEMGYGVFNPDERKIANEYLYYLNFLNGRKSNPAKSNHLEEIKCFATNERKEKHSFLASFNCEMDDYRNSINHANFNKNTHTVSENLNKIIKISDTVKEYIENILSIK